MRSDLVIEVVRVIPTILWVVVAIVVFLRFQRPISELLPRIGGVKAFGVEVAFVQQELARAVDKQAVLVQEETASKGIEAPAVHASETELLQFARRARLVAPVLRNAEILWVDDEPEHNAQERRTLHDLGIFVDPVRSTSDALRMLLHGHYDVVISDMVRDRDPVAGMKLLEELRRMGSDTPLIFYVGAYDPSTPIPPRAFGITNNPVPLFHYVLDVLERSRS